MRLESALFSGQSGIDAHGKAIAVIGDNISNVNTTAFKESDVQFADILTVSSDGAPGSSVDEAGGGVFVSEVKQNFNVGVLEQTGRALDAGIDGNGFFVVGDPASPLLTRAGNFSLDGTGNLVTADGYNVLGLPSGSTTLGPLNLYNLNLTASATTTGSAVGNLDAGLPITTVPTNPTTFQEVSRASSFMQSFTVYDSLGAPREIPVAFFKTAAGTWKAQAYIDGGQTANGTAGTPVKIGAETELKFSESGALTGAVTITANPAYGNGAAAGNFTIDLSKMTQFASASSISNFSQNGQGVGNISGYEIRANGEIYAQLDNGDPKLIATLQLANYPNTEGLERLGGNIYRPLPEAGTAAIGSPGTGSLGNIGGASLELSDVDLATQFTDLIIVQRGFQANAQVVTKTTEMLQTALGMLR